MPFSDQAASILGRGENLLSGISPGGTGAGTTSPTRPSHPADARAAEAPPVAAPPDGEDVAAVAGLAVALARARPALAVACRRLPHRVREGAVGAVGGGGVGAGPPVAGPRPRLAHAGL